MGDLDCPLIWIRTEPDSTGGGLAKAETRLESETRVEPTEQVVSRV